MKKEHYEKIIEELIKLIDEGVYIVDKQCIGRFYNDIMASMEKVNMDDVLGKRYQDAFPDVRTNDSTMMKALFNGEATVKQQQSYKNFYGKEVTTVNSTVPVIIDGETVAAIEVAKDITDIRRMSDTLLELQKSDKSSARPKNSAIKRYTFDDIYGKNGEFEVALHRAKKAAENDAAVFIYGETGTGKELFAQSIHTCGKRKDKPFLAQNCAAIPESLLEGILFGTAKGSFTGAVDREGMFEQANGGTLLLDEISAMPYDLQSKLLRVLQEDYIRRVGGMKDIPINVRIVSATNKNLMELVREGKFREDLYYRLNVVPINVPPLRDRPEDILPLIQTNLAKYNEHLHESKTISSEVLAVLLKYQWPGNIRELLNIIERLIITTNEDVITEENLPIFIKQEAETNANMNTDLSLSAAMAKAEKDILQEALSNYKSTRAMAKVLQVSQPTIVRKLHKYGLSNTPAD